MATSCSVSMTSSRRSPAGRLSVGVNVSRFGEEPKLLSEILGQPERDRIGAEGLGRLLDDRPGHFRQLGRGDEGPGHLGQGVTLLEVAKAADATRRSRPVRARGCHGAKQGPARG